MPWNPYKKYKRFKYKAPDPNDKGYQEGSLVLPVLYALLASVILFVLVMAAGIAATYNADPIPTQEPHTPYIAPTSSPKPSPSPSPSPSPTPEPTPSPSPEPSESPADESADPDASESPADESASPEVTAEPSAEPSPSPSPSPTPSAQPSPSPSPTPEPSPSPAQTTAKWVLDTYFMMIHDPSCRLVQDIAAQNYATTNSSESFLLSQGYVTCNICH